MTRVIYTREEMEACFKAGADFARDMFNNPSNTEYLLSLDENNELLQNDGK